MHKVELKIHGGGELEVHGSLTDRRILVILNRENFWRDDPLVARLIAGLTARQWTVARYQSETVCTTRRISRRWFERMPAGVSQALKALLLLRYPARWRHFFPAAPRRDRQHRLPRAVAARVGALAGTRA